MEVNILEKTGCRIVAVKRHGLVTVSPNPAMGLEHDAEMPLIGTSEAENLFMESFSIRP